MQSDRKILGLAGLTAAVVTTATFAKLFVPFYLIGSTAIFAVASSIGFALVALSGRQICNRATRIADILAVLGLFYGVVIINYFASSRPEVPVTYLLGILIFHALFMIFGFAASRDLKAVLSTLLAGAAIYSIVIIQYTARFGDPMRKGYLDDIFGVGDPATFITFHQNIGAVLGLGALAALGLGSSWIRRMLAIGASALVLLFMFHIAARTAMVALVCGLIFLAGAGLWVRSKKLAVLTIVAVVVTATLASGIFYQRALQDKDVDAAAQDAISRTIREIQDPRPLFRLQIWARAWERATVEPGRLLLGRGIGMFPVDEGYGAPDWLLHKAEGSKYYPHSLHLEILYETGIAGLLLFSILTIFPLVVALRRWHLFSLAERSAASIYVFSLASAEISGSFAFSYDFQFFFALMVGVIASERMRYFELPRPVTPPLR
jgi:O-antigen ligase